MRRVHRIRHVHKYETLGNVFKVLLISLQIPSSLLDIFILVVILGSQFQRLLKNRFCFFVFCQKAEVKVDVHTFCVHTCSIVSTCKRNLKKNKYNIRLETANH